VNSIRRRLKQSGRQEQQGMTRFGGVRNPRSGARWDRKNDGRTRSELVEFKRTSKRSITLKYDDLVSLRYHAMVESRRPILDFELGGDSFVVLSERDYLELVELRPQPGADSHNGAATGTGVDEPGQVYEPVRQWIHEPVLRRPPAQRPSQRGQERVLGNPPGPPRSVPGPERMSRLRPRQRGEVGRMGGTIRKGTPQAEAARTATDS